jgi:hypothetical protein
VRRFGLFLFITLIVSIAAAPAPLLAQGTIEMNLPTDVPFPAAPTITIRALGFPASAAPLAIRLRIGLDPNLGLLVFDSTLAGPAATFVLLKLLPENQNIFVQAIVLDQAGGILATQTRQGGRTGPRLELVSPAGPTNVVLRSRQPTFVWRSAKVSNPPGPWVYELFVTNVASQVTRSVPNLVDTVVTFPVELEASTSYRWEVHARLLNGFASDAVRVSAVSSFSIQSSDEVVRTLLYQNFPNPFPTATLSSTCVWFDLKVSGRVELQVLDLRGHRVRTLIPGALPSDLPAGRYGRGSETGDMGCDPRLSWDGRADDGRVLPSGLYLLRLKTSDVPESMKKIYFRGF